MKSEFASHLMALKKKKFIETVIRVCKKRHLPVPTVNFKGCGERLQDELAHYHPDRNMICCTEDQLRLMDLDYVQHAAAHEVSHILIHGHGADFQAEEAESKIAAWHPSGGVTHIDGGARIDYSKFPKVKMDKERCNYHICRKKTKLLKCQYCKKYFCKEHIFPFEPFIGINKKYRHSNEGHPCPSYVAHQAKEKEERHLTRREVHHYTKDRIGFSKKPTVKPSTKEIISLGKEIKEKVLLPIKEEHLEIQKEKHENSIRKQKKESSIKGDKTTVLTSIATISLVLIILIGSLILIDHFTKEEKLCNDNTPYNQCSNNTPFYCSEGKLVEKPSLCGCPDKYEARDETCVKIKYCSDKTKEGECSKSKPLYCIRGTLIENQKLCG